MQTWGTRRAFLARAAAVAAVGVVADGAKSDEGPPETLSVRLPAFPNVSDCQAPLYASRDLLLAEGFTDVSFVDSGTGPDSADWLAHGEIDFDWNFPPAHIRSIDGGAAIRVLAGMHVGCLELIANREIRGVPDLKGRKVGVDMINGSPHALLRIMAAYVGLDPDEDLSWVTSSDPVQALADGEIDAFLATPPQPQAARDMRLGHVIVNTSVDRPWSQYFCCMLATSDNYARSYPVATKRVVRAVLKAVDLCITDPPQIAAEAVRGGFAANYDLVLRALRDGRYGVWREYDPEDSLRFYALRMQETGATSMNPQKVIHRGADWSFLNEVKRELKA